MDTSTMPDIMFKDRNIAKLYDLINNSQSDTNTESENLFPISDKLDTISVLAMTVIAISNNRQQIGHNDGCDSERSFDYTSIPV